MFFDEETIHQVWEKGAPIIDLSPDEWRRDEFGNPIQRREYGNRLSNWGWEIDHVLPKADGGSDDLSNLRPLQWAANVDRN